MLLKINGCLIRGSLEIAKSDDRLIGIATSEIKAND